MVRVRVRIRRIWNVLRGSNLLGLGVAITSYDFTLRFLYQGWPDSHIQSLSTISLGGHSSGAAFLPIP